MTDENPTVHEVHTVSGESLCVLTAAEKRWYENSRDTYLSQTKFTDTTDLRDLDRLLFMELMVFRLSQHLAAGGIDYEGFDVDETLMRRNVREYCVDDQTEAMTDQGWQRWDQLTDRQLLLTLNTSTGLSEWQPIQDRFVGRASGPMIHMSSHNHDSLTTPDHRWWVRDPGGWRWRTSATLAVNSRIPTAANHDGFPETPKYSDALVRLMAWFWTEGSICWNRRSGEPCGVEITQSPTANPGGVTDIRTSLIQLLGSPGPLGHGDAPHWNETLRNGQAVFRLSRLAGDALLRHAPGMEVKPDFLLSLTSSQLDTFIWTSVAGDGWFGAKGCVRIGQREEKRSRAFEMACVLAGRQTQTSLNSIEMFETGLLRRNGVRPISAVRQDSRASRRWVDYDGPIWCPVTANGTWLARRAGSVYYTGNSEQITRVKSSMGLTKSARDEAANSGDVAGYISQLLAKGKIFGIHRENQLKTALVLMNELSAIVGSFDRSDQEERERLGFTSEAEIVQWIRNHMLPKYREVDEHFRENEQRYWVRSM